MGRVIALAHYKFDGTHLKDEHYHTVANVHGNEIKDEHYNKIASLDDIRKSIDGIGSGMHLVAMWLFFVR